MTAPPSLSLEDARRRLRDLGYLNGRVERFVFRRAFERRGGLFLPAIFVGAFAAALASVAAVAAAEPGFRESAVSMVVLFGHLFVADLAVAALLALLLAFAADRSRAPAAMATAAGLAASAAVLLLWIAGTYGLTREVPALALLWGAPVCLAALLTARSVRSGFLARAYSHSGVLPERPRRRVFFAAAAVGLLVAAAVFASRRAPAPVSPPQPSPRKGAVVVVAVDGLALDARASDSLFGARELLGRGVTAWWPAKSASPPEIWSDLATGVPASRHAVRALERVRPRGAPLALRPPPGTSWYLRRLGPKLRLVSSAPVSANDRRSLAFWEVAASSGVSAVAVGWWASGPWPGASVVGNEEILSGAADGVEADRRAIALFRAKRTGQPIQTVYLPGLDILRNDESKWHADLAQVRRFLEDMVSDAAGRGDVLVVLAAESHPSPGALGRAFVLDAPLSPRTIRIRPEDVAPSILARAGVPAASDLPGRPNAALFKPGSLETLAVATYGPRVAPPQATSRSTDREYLEKLKSLGYLK